MSSVVALCIPTFKRPNGLRRLLASVQAIEFNGDLRVVVVDNDAENQEGVAVCADCEKNGYRWPIICVPEHRSGHSYACNTAFALGLKTANVEFVVMVDDDEFVEPQWLTELIKVQRRTNADIVGGPVLPFAKETMPVWATRGKFFDRPRHNDGIVRMINGSGNILILAPILNQYLPEVFPKIFAKSGGGDADFFKELKRDGKVFAWADKAVVHEVLPESRINKNWLRQRAYRIGNTNVAIQRRYEPGPLNELKRLAKTAGLLSLSSLYLMLSWPSELHRLKASLLFFKGLGKLKGHLGGIYLEYESVHGD